MPGSVVRVKQLFDEKKKSFLLSEIKDELPDLKICDISMALSYLYRKGFASRRLVASRYEMGRKAVWRYTYNEVREKPSNPLEDK